MAQLITCGMVKMIENLNNLQPKSLFGIAVHRLNVSESFNYDLRYSRGPLETRFIKGKN